MIRKIAECIAFSVMAIFGAVFMVAVMGFYFARPAKSDPAIHRHAGESAAVDAFYSDWHMPDRPNLPCCNKTDCYATEARFTDGHWVAKRREDGAWLRIPEAKIERGRDNPDARAHMCAPPPNSFSSFAVDGVFCFSVGGGS